ncbi:Acyl-coenzyme A oxidase [Podosphaera aphanis]|nr:Acyl-coenzyme A oxidase [Podosphaera aphanis]
MTPSSQPELMKRARCLSTFNAFQMAEVIYGSAENIQRRREAFSRIEKAIGTDDNLVLPKVYDGSSRENKYLEGLRTGKICYEDGLKHGTLEFAVRTPAGHLSNANPFGLTRLLFLPFFKLQASDEQIAAWGGLVERGAWICSYAQTELGHGSHVGGIETTATLDRETDEFIVNSPNPASAKFWPGGIGFSVSHTALMARLIIDNKDHGVHGFMVQLRSLVDFKPLPGIELGDIGMKMGYNATDNGYAIFHNHRIPRANLLMRHARVSKEGIYDAHPLRLKLLYGGMLSGRVHIIETSASQLAQALTIAVRYSAVREQGNSISPARNGEVSVIGYKHQYYRLLYLISRSYVMLLSRFSAVRAYDEMTALQDKGDYTMLPFLHQLMCGLKAWCTQTASDGAEECRKMCGGHGFMMISGLPDIVSHATAMCTFEGENYVLWAQVSRYLIKCLESDSLPPEIAYLRHYCPQGKDMCKAKGAGLSDHSNLLEIFKRRAAQQTFKAIEAVRAEINNGKPSAVAWNIQNLPLLVASRAVIEVYILEQSIKQLAALSSSTPAAVKNALSSLISLFALTAIAAPFAPYTSSFFEDGYLSPIHLDAMRQEIDRLLETLYPDLIALTDAWDFSDASLASAIGCRDGDAYNRIMTWTKQLPMNLQAQRDGGVFLEGYQRHIKPFLERGARAKL